LLATAPNRPLPTAVASLLVVAAGVAALLLVWARSVRRSLERAEISGSRRRRSTVLAPRGVPLPAGRVGAIMAKDLRYLMREPRRLVASLTSVLFPARRRARTAGTL
jgi:ABC-2 type transport system permease protein